MRRFILLVSLALLLLVSLSLTELADTPAAPDVLQRQGVVLEVNVDDALWLQPQAASADAATLNGWTTIVSEDFEGAFPGEWTVFDDEPGSGEYHWAKRDCEAYSGRYSGWAVGGGGDGAGLSCGADYPNNAKSVMIYGPFGLADASAAELTFQLWLDCEWKFDSVAWLASLDGSRFAGSGRSADSDGWMPIEFDLTDVYELGDLTGESRVWVMLLFESDSSINEPEGAYVDDIVLRKYVGSGPAETPTRTRTPTRTGTPTRTRTPTRTLSPTATRPGAALAVYLPIIARSRPLPTPTPTATQVQAPTPTDTRPAPTPTEPAGEEWVYKGTTSQGRDIELKVKPDQSAVTYLKIDYSFYCGGITRTGTTTITSAGGWTITDRSFEVESRCNIEVTGTFDPSFNSASGTWRGIACDPIRPWIEVCRGPVGTWDATRQ